MSRKSTNATSYEVFETTMNRLEQALSVGQIATFHFIACDATDDPQDVLDRYPDFDQIPIQREGKVIGVLEREKGEGNTAAEAMRPLDVDMLVAAEEPIARFIPCLLEAPYYRLVLTGHELTGIVTRSDLLKLPVRLLAFARITHLELILANLITVNYSQDDDWLALLEEKEQKSIKRHHERLSRGRIETTLLEVSRFDHKYEVVSNLPDIGGYFAADMAGIKALRDELAHAKDFVTDEEALGRFLKRLQLADRWIAELTKRLDECITENQRSHDAETTGHP